MSVGILLITHNNIGQALLEVATQTFGCLPLEASLVAVDNNPNPDLLISQSIDLVNKLNSSGKKGVLVLTDMFGSTPSNIAHALYAQNLPIKVISGCNLPMLFRIFNYPTLGLDQLAQKAVNGAKDGIFMPLTPQNNCSYFPQKQKKSAKYIKLVPVDPD